MAKKRFLSLMLMMAMLPLSSVNVSAIPYNIPFEVRYDDPSNPFPNQHKQPAQVPQVNIDEFVLTFFTSCDGCLLRLIDEDGNEAFTIMIPDNTTSMGLPPYLEGTFELQIIRGGWRFCGWINL